MSGPTDFLYPMVDGEATDVEALLADLSSSARRKLIESAEVTAAARNRWASTLEQLASTIASAARSGGTVFTMGNGGSATDADGAASLFSSPPDGTAVPVRSLVADIAVVTALANDVGFERVFARQLLAHGRPGDVVIGFSTSGNSTNLLAAFETARQRGMTTAGFAGDRGGAMAACEHLDHLVIVETASIHRIQEAQAALVHDLWQHTQRLLRDDPTIGTGT